MALLAINDGTIAMLRRRAFSLPFVLSTIAAWFVLSREVTQNTLGLDVEFVHRFSALYLCAQLFIVYGSDTMLRSARWAWVRVPSIALVIAGGFVYGASSSIEVSPAWGFALSVPHLGVRCDLHRKHWSMVMFALLGPVLHLALAPHVTATSLGAAVVVGLAATLVLYLIGRREDETAGLSAAAQLGRHQLDSRLGLLARVAVAMEVHDQLSGLLVSARLKVKRAGAYAEVAPAIAALLEASRTVLDPQQPRSGKFLASLREAVEAQGASLDLRLEQRRLLTLREEHDVRDIVFEACLNAARARVGCVVKLHLVIDSAGVTISCRGSGGSTGTASGNGRGLRNMRLRTWARGGTFSFDAEAQGSTLHVSWPEHGGRRRVGLATGVMMVVAATIPAIAEGRALALACMLVIGALTTLVLRLADLEGDRRREIAADPGSDSGETKRGVKAALSTALESLEAAHRHEQLAETGVALRTLSEQFATVLAELERESLPLMPQLAPRIASAPRFVFEPHHQSLFGWRLVVSVGVSSVLLSLPATISLLHEPAFAFRTINALGFGASLLAVVSVRQWASAPWGVVPRMAVLLLLNVVAASTGAMSAESFSPGWVLFVFALFFNAQFPVHRVGWLLLAIAIASAPLALRWAFVPDASATSLIFAAALGMFVAGASFVLARRQESVVHLEAFEFLDAREATARSSVVDGLATAMELHDGLGGALLSLRLKLKRATPWDELESAMTRVLARGEELLAAEHRPIDEWPEVLRSTSQRAVSLTLEGDTAALTPGEKSDVWSIARRFAVEPVESAQALSIRVKVSRRKVEVTVVDATGALLAADARPTRNAKLRVWARGGTFTHPSRESIVLRWSRQSPKRLASFVALCVVSLAIFTTFPKAEGSALHVMSLMCVMSALGFFVFRQLDSRRRTVVPKLENASMPARSVASLKLQAGLAALSKARQLESIPEATLAARSLGEALVETVRVLEEAPLQALGPMNPVPAGPLR